MPAVPIRKRVAFAMLLLCCVAGCATSARQALLTDPPKEGDYASVFMIGDARAGVMATGFLVVQKGKQYIVTARHVIDKLRDSIDFRTKAGIFRERIASRWRGDSLDVGVLTLAESIRHPSLPTTPIATTEGFTVGTEAWVLGFPSQVKLLSANSMRMPVLTHAYFSGITEDRAAYLLNAQALPGMSGGPVFMRNEQGEVSIVGVQTSVHTVEYAGSESLTQLSFAAPIIDLGRILETIPNAPADQLWK